jgi:hypothetical protein
MNSPGRRGRRVHRSSSKPSDMSAATAWGPAAPTSSACFCPRCHSMMDLPDLHNTMRCAFCTFEQTTAGAFASRVSPDPITIWFLTVPDFRRPVPSRARRDKIITGDQVKVEPRKQHHTGGYQYGPKCVARSGAEFCTSGDHVLLFLLGIRLCGNDSLRAYYFSISPQFTSNSLFFRSRRNAPNAITAKCTFTPCSCALLTKARPYFTSASSASTSITSIHEARSPQPMGFRSTMYKVKQAVFIFRNFRRQVHLSPCGRAKMHKFALSLRMRPLETTSICNSFSHFPNQLYIDHEHPGRGRNINLIKSTIRPKEQIRKPMLSSINLHRRNS